MKKIIYEGGDFVFIDGGRRELLLDTGNLMSNKSRYPMQLLQDGKTGIPGLLAELAQKHDGMNCGEDFFPYYLIDLIVISRLIRTPVPLKVLEIGATSGILSYHLAVLMGKLNRESLLCCVSNVVGNSSGNHWLDRVSMVDGTPSLSLLISDYEDTQLGTGNFDIVILNGTDRFCKPYETVREAQRLVKGNGFLLCHTKDSPLLESSFKLVFPERREYGISPQEMVLAVPDPGTSWKQDEDERPTLEEKAAAILLEMQQVIKPGCRPDEVRPFIGEIDRCTELAMEYFDIGRKVELLRLKEAALNYMLNIGKEFEGYYRGELAGMLGI